MIKNFGFYVVPIALTIIISASLFKRVPAFEAFLEGAGEGIKSTFAIAPSLIGLITAISMLKCSGALDLFKNLMIPIANIFNFPPDVIPLALLRPISGSGSIALLDNIFKTCGPESHAGKLGSLIMGSTETTFYTLAVYFGSVKIKNYRHTLICALIADFTAIIMSVLISNLFYH